MLTSVFLLFSSTEKQIEKATEKAFKNLYFKRREEFDTAGKGKLFSIKFPNLKHYGPALTNFDEKAVTKHPTFQKNSSLT